VQQYEFASPQWLAALHGIMAARASIYREELADCSFAACEVFTGVPPAVNDASDGRVAFHWRVRAGDFSWLLHEADDVDHKAVADWSSILPLARTVFAGDTAAAETAGRLHADVLAAGKLRVSGSLAGAPRVFAGVHDDIARLTSTGGHAH